MATRDTRHEVGEARLDTRPRRRYSKPRIVSREAIEAMAASCGTPGGKPDPIMCPSGPIQS